MEAIHIPEEQVTAMDDIASGVRGLRITFVKNFGIEHGAGSVLERAVVSPPTVLSQRTDTRANGR